MGRMRAFEKAARRGATTIFGLVAQQKDQTLSADLVAAAETGDVPDF
jgi:hypothetical protein